VLQNSKVAASRILRENKKREMIADSCALNRVAELAGEFDVRGAVPSHLYIKDAPAARRIFDHLCRTTFATQSPRLRPFSSVSKMTSRRPNRTSALLQIATVKADMLRFRFVPFSSLIQRSIEPFWFDHPMNVRSQRSMGFK
jgi:hypothetical protein